MQMRIARSAVLGAMLGGSLALVAFPARAIGDDAPVLSLHAFAINFTGVGTGGSGELDIIIERWSTDQERDEMQSVLAEKGAGALLQALQQVKPRAGYVRIKPRMGSSPGSASPNWEIQFARSAELPDGGRRVVMATGRPRTAAERTKHNRSEEYEFLLVEIRLDKDGKGEGKTADGTKVTFNEKTGSPEVDQYATQPVQLIKVEEFKAGASSPSAP